jgi:hypothetical protein
VHHIVAEKQKGEVGAYGWSICVGGVGETKQRTHFITACSGENESNRPRIDPV